MPAAEVQPPLVVDHLAAVHVQRLVLHLEADDLAVGHVHHRLAVLREAVARARRTRAGRTRRSRSGRCRSGRPARPRRGCRAGPMCPFERANSDSAWASRSMSTPSSTSAQGSTGWRGSGAHPTSSAEVAHHDVGAVLEQSLRAGRGGPPPRTSPKLPARPASTPASASSKTTASLGIHSQQLGRPQERVRRRLAGQVLARDHHSVHAHVEEIADAGGLEDLLGVGARGHHRRLWPGVARRLHEAHASPRRRSTPSSVISCCTSSFLRFPTPRHGLRLRAGRPARPSGSSIPLEARKSRTPS